MFMALKSALLTKKSDSDALVESIVKLAERARREGLLALEDGMKDVENEFLRKGLQLAIDGTDQDELQDILEAEVEAKRKVDKLNAKILADMGAYAPTVGIIGTVLGLINALENLNKPEKLGHLIASAFVATLWGVLSANLLWLPLSAKAQAHVGARDRRDGDGHRRHREHPVRRQPAPGRPEAAQPAAAGRGAGRREEGGLMSGGHGRRGGKAAGTRASSARGAREPRALAGQLRRHDDAADGALPRVVRDEPGRPQQVRQAQVRPRGRLRRGERGFSGSRAPRGVGKRPRGPVRPGAKVGSRRRRARRQLGDEELQEASPRPTAPSQSGHGAARRG